MMLKPRKFPYHTEVRWTEEHKGVISSPDKPDVEIACPPEFGGHAGYWSAEDLFVAAVNTCIMTTFLSLAEERGIQLISYHSKGTGTAQLVERTFRFAVVEIQPVIVVSRKEEVRKAKEAMHDTAETCMVSKSLRTDVVVHPKIREMKCDV